MRKGSNIRHLIFSGVAGAAVAKPYNGGFKATAWYHRKRRLQVPFCHGHLSG